jgi:phosphopantetheine adenylyltransferase
MSVSERILIGVTSDVLL